MSAGAVLRRALSACVAVPGAELIDAEVVAALRAARADVAALLWSLGDLAGRDVGLTLDRAAACFLNYGAANLADDLADGDCDYLDEPRRTGSTVQYLLHHVSYLLLIRAAGLSELALSEVAGDLAAMSGPQRLELRTQTWDLRAARLVAEGITGRQFSAYFRVMWHGTSLAGAAAEVGGAFGFAAHVVTDAASGDPRFTTLPGDAQLALINDATARMDLVRRIGTGRGAFAVAVETIDRGLRARASRAAAPAG